MVGRNPMGASGAHSSTSTPYADGAAGACGSSFGISEFSSSTRSWASSATLGDLVLGERGAD